VSEIKTLREKDINWDVQIIAEKSGFLPLWLHAIIFTLAAVIILTNIEQFYLVNTSSTAVLWVANQLLIFVVFGFMEISLRKKHSHRFAMNKQGLIVAKKEKHEYKFIPWRAINDVYKEKTKNGKIDRRSQNLIVQLKETDGTDLADTHENGLVLRPLVGAFVDPRNKYLDFAQNHIKHAH
jgi:hypothetical protein